MENSKECYFQQYKHEILYSGVKKDEIQKINAKNPPKIKYVLNVRVGDYKGQLKIYQLNL